MEIRDTNSTRISGPEMTQCVDGQMAKPINTPQNSDDQEQFWSSKSEDSEQRENRKNRRKECVIQGQRACARIGHCLVRALACVFD